MIVHRCEQGTPLWWAVKCGIPSASNFHKIVTPTGQPSKSATSEGYIDELIADRIIGLPQNVGAMMTRPTYTSGPMQEGIDTEPLARQWYKEHRTDIFDDTVEQVGFITDDDGRVGLSPDGLRHHKSTPEGGLEIKCPMLKTHIGWSRAGVLPSKHVLQVKGSLAVTRLDYWDFLSYCEGVPPLVVRVEPDESTEELRAHLFAFADKLEAAWKQIEPTLLVPEAVGVDDPKTPF